MLRKIYRYIHIKSPDSLKGLLTRATFILTDKPYVKKDNIDRNKKFPNREKGGLIISADFELSWAWRYTKTGSDYIQKGKQGRENFPLIIKILEEYNIPISFATVGHLFLETCKKGEHDWMSRIPYFDDHWKYTSGDWFDHDPYSDYKKAPEWYAPDLIKMIIDSKVEHEIGCHTFTHIDFSDKNCPKNVAVDEIKACEQAAEKFDVKLKSIVFPGGTWGNISVLKDNNFLIYRRNFGKYDLHYPFRDEFGLLVTPTSGALEFNLNYGWSAKFFLKKLKRHIDKAIESGTIAHLWFHPSCNSFFIKNIFPHFFKYAVAKREKGELWIGTMQEIADYINHNKIC